MNTVGRPELYSVLRQTDDVTSGTVINTPAPTLTLANYASQDGWVTCLGPDGFSGISSLKIVPFGTDTAAQTFLMAVYGWTPTTGNASNPSSIKQPLWVPTLLAKLTCTLGSNTAPVMLGVSGTDVDASHFFCNALSIGIGNSNYTVEVVSPAGPTGIAHAVVAVKDALYVQILFAINASAVSCNALVQRM